MSESNTSHVSVGKFMVERFGVWNGQVYLVFGVGVEQEWTCLHRETVKYGADEESPAVLPTEGASQ